MDIRLKHLHKKDLIFIQGGITLSEVNTWVYIGPAYQGIFVATWENYKNREIVRYTDVISENKHWKGPFMVTLQTILV